MSRKKLIIGPQPPAIGGIASIVSLLRSGLDSEHVSFIDTGKPDKVIKKMIWPLLLVVKIFCFVLIHRPEKVMMFSSANNSFWEKCIWGIVITSLGGKASMVMVDGHFPEFFANLSGLEKRTARLFVKRVKIVAQSQRWEEYYRSIFPDSGIGQITGGVDTDFFCPVDRGNDVENSQSDIIILFVGLVVKEKGIHDLLKSMEVLKRSRGLEGLSLRLVGPVAMDRDKLQAAMENHGISEYVEVAGPVNSRNLMRQEFNSADIFVFPSLYEGFPVALLEAVSSGLPSVGSAVGSIPDIIENGVNGFVVPPNSPENLADAIQRLIDDETLRIEMGSRCRESALKNYTYSSCLQSYKTILGIDNY